MPAMKRALFLLALALSACTAPAPQIVTQSIYRNAATPIWSAAAFQPGRISGEWRQVAAFTPGESQGCRPGALRFEEGAAGLEVRGQLCLNGRLTRLSGPARSTGPGRLQLAGMGEWWVIWVDSGYRTLAIATPGGEFGFVLDRGSISGDRLRAAAEIFDFNGYPKARLRGF